MEQWDWPEWQEAIDDQLAPMAKYRVWGVVEEPGGESIFRSHWVFQIKL